MKIKRELMFINIKTLLQFQENWWKGLSDRMWEMTPPPFIFTYKVPKIGSVKSEVYENRQGAYVC